MMASLIDVTSAELEDVARRGPSAAELNRAKAQLKAGLLMSLESSSARAEQMARHLLAHGRIVGSDELIRNVDAVSVEDVGRFAQDLLVRTPSVAVVGAGKASQRLASEALQRMTRGSVSSEAKTA
jgi:predicted Zn-dependent peptidase